LIEIEFRGPEENAVSEYANRFVQLLDVQNPMYQVLGPSPGPLAKIQGNYRFHIILNGDRHKDPSGNHLRTAVKRAMKDFQKRYRPRQVKISIDVDPVDLW